MCNWAVNCVISKYLEKWIQTQYYILGNIYGKFKRTPR